MAHTGAPLGYKAAVQRGTLDIRQELDGERFRLILTGELNLTTSAALEQAVSAALAEGARELILDLQQLAFVDSTGFRALLAAKDGCVAAGAGFAMTRGSDAAQRVFDASGIRKRLPFV